MLHDFPSDDIDALATGAWILGTGGGGNPYMSQLNLTRLYAQGHVCKVMAPGDLADDDLVAVVSKMGAPLVGQERLVDPSHLARAVTLMEETLGRRFTAIMSLEIGGGNALSPFLAGALLDRPVVDGDSMGRAFPEAQMTSFAISDLRPYPLSMVDCRANEAVIAKAASWRWMERMSRTLCTELGSTAATCKAPRTGAEVKAYGIHDSVTRAVRLGRAVLEARRAHADPVQAILAVEQGKRLFTGKVTDVDRTTAGGFLRGKARLAGLGAEDGQQMVLDFQNEWIVAWHDGRAVATSPDLICLIDSDSGEAIGTETVRYGQRATVIALPSAPILRTPQGLANVGPRAFGYDFDFVSVFGE